MNHLSYLCEQIRKKEISRRKFLKLFIISIFTLIMRGLVTPRLFAKAPAASPRKRRAVTTAYDLVVAEGSDAYKNTVAAVTVLGGIEQFVKKGDTVVIKPNMAWDRSPEQAANTDPNVVAALVALCKEAGAKRVSVFDVTCNDARRSYRNSGIEQAAKGKGAFVYIPEKWDVVRAAFPYKSQMEGWDIVREAAQCDVFINVPILKHHRLTGLTLSMKNLMGVCMGTRGMIHLNIGQKLVDMTDFIQPDLTVIDATRALTAHGPSGGNVADVVTLNKVIAGVDPTCVDSFACTLLDRDPMSIPYIAVAVERGFGNADLSKAKIKMVKV